MTFEITIDPFIPPYEMKLDKNTIDMGVVSSGDGLTSLIGVYNWGLNPLHMKPLPECEGFVLSWTGDSDMTIQPNRYEFLHVECKQNLPIGLYEDKVQIETQEGISLPLTLRILIDPASQKDYDLDISNSDVTVSDWLFSDPDAELFIIVKNIGKKPTKITRDTSGLKHFRLYDNSKESEEEDWDDPNRTLQPGERSFIYISALEIFGNFEEKFYIYTDDGSEFPITIRMNNEKPVKPEHLERYVKITPTSEVKLDTVYAFYEKLPKAQTITLENKASKPVNLSQQGMDGLKIGKLSKNRLEPGEKAEFTVQPKLGLAPGTYHWLVPIGVTSDSGETAYKYETVVFDVSTSNFEGPNEIPGVKGLTNGTEKTSDGLKLPKSVSVKGANDTDFVESVTWDTENCAYDPQVKEEQNFVVKGQLNLLPEQNNKHLDATVEIEVQVLAYDPLGQPVFDKVTVKNNYLDATLYDKINEASGYQFVLVEEEADLDKNVFAKSVDSLTTSVRISMIQKGDYFLYCRPYKQEDGKNVYGKWSEGKPISIEVVTGMAPVISNDTVKGCDVRFTVTIPDEADGFDAVLARKESGGKPKDYELVKKNQSADKKTFVLNGAAKGTYYVGVHSYTRQNGYKILSPWSNLLKVTVKEGRVTTAPVVKKVSVSGRNVTITINRAKGTVGSDWILAEGAYQMPDGSYVNVYYVRYAQKNKTGTKITFTNVKPGTYYLAGHAFRKGYRKSFTDWAKVRKIVVKG